MKIVHLSTVDSGGAYKAAERISNAMIKCGIDSKLVVRAKVSKNSQAEGIFHNPLQILVSKVKNLGNILLSGERVHSEFFGTNIVKNRTVLESDIIVFHWVNRFIGYKSIKQALSMGKPIVWVMHDMWSFTGGCHYSDECIGYEEECSNCPYINKKKVPQRNFQRKKEVLDESGLVIVGPSRWIVDCAGKSAITTKLSTYIINNPIDTDVFKPLEAQEKEKRRQFKIKYNISDNKKIVLLGAMGTGIGGIKGFDLFEEVLEKVDYERYSFVVMGNHEWMRNVHTSAQIINLGFISSEKELVQKYNLADVFLSLSKQDNYPNVILEALACGTPVVCFGTGGITEQVFHQKNGYIAQIGKVDEIVAGIEWTVSNHLKTGQSLLMTDNSYLEIGSQYKQLCEKLLIGR